MCIRQNIKVVGDYSVVLIMAVDICLIGVHASIHTTNKLAIIVEKGEDFQLGGFGHLEVLKMKKEGRGSKVQYVHYHWS